LFRNNIFNSFLEVEKPEKKDSTKMKSGNNGMDVDNMNVQQNNQEVLSNINFYFKINNNNMGNINNMNNMSIGNSAMSNVNNPAPNLNLYNNLNYYGNIVNVNNNLNNSDSANKIFEFDMKANNQKNESSADVLRKR
jgi:hypothetical protein